MKRYLAFAGDSYYPEGGWNDFRGDFDSPQAAVDALAVMGGFDWWHIVDSEDADPRRGRVEMWGPRTTTEQASTPRTLTKSVMDKFAAYHKREIEWGIFHVALSDGNYKLDCEEPRTDEERELATIFRKLSATQRAKLANRA